MTRERLTFGHGAHRAVPTRVVADASVRADDPGRVRLLRIDTWDWGWGGLLIFTVLLFFRPQDQIPGLKNAHLSDIAAVIGLIGMVTVNLARRQPIARMTPELLGMLALGLVVGLTIPMSFWPTGSLDVFVNLYLPILLIVTLMVNTITSPKRIERMVWVIVLAFGYMSARVIFDYMRGVNVMGGRAMGPVGGFFSNPNDLALNLVAFLPLVVMYVKRPGAFGKRVLCVAIAAMMLVAMVFTKSRGGTLGAVAMLAAFFYVARLITPVTIIAGVLAGMLVLPAMPDSFRLARRAAPAADPGRGGLPRESAHRHRRRTVPELLAPRAGEEVARGAQRAAAGRGRGRHLRAHRLQLPHRPGVHRLDMDEAPPRRHPETAVAQPR